MGRTSTGESDRPSAHPGIRRRKRGQRRQAMPPAGADYDRSRDLPPLLALWPWEIRDTTFGGQQQLVARLRRALRLERQRAIAGHWTYDLARHARLLAAYKNEAERLAEMAGRVGEEMRRQQSELRQPQAAPLGQGSAS